MTIVEFLTARYAEAEQIAKAASHEVALAEDRYSWASVDYWSEENDKHGTLWSPERVLADIAAKRAVVNYEPYGGEGSDSQMAHEEILCILTAPYATHPDYSPEWKP